MIQFLGRLLHRRNNNDAMTFFRCKKCNKILLRATGTAYIEIFCPKCGAPNKYNIKNDKEIREDI